MAPKLDQSQGLIMINDLTIASDHANTQQPDNVIYMDGQRLSIPSQQPEAQGFGAPPRASLTESEWVKINMVNNVEKLDQTNQNVQISKDEVMGVVQPRKSTGSINVKKKKKKAAAGKDGDTKSKESSKGTPTSIKMAVSPRSDKETKSIKSRKSKPKAYNPAAQAEMKP